MNAQQFCAIVVNEFCRAKCEGLQTKAQWLMGARWLFGYHGEHVAGPSAVCIGRSTEESDADSVEWKYDVPAFRVLVHVAAHDTQNLLCYADVDIQRFKKAFPQ